MTQDEYNFPFRVDTENCPPYSFLKFWWCGGFVPCGRTRGSRLDKRSGRVHCTRDLSGGSEEIGIRKKRREFGPIES